MKTCTKCGKPKLLTEFHKKKVNKDGRMAQCKACEKQRDRSHYKSNEPLRSVWASMRARCNNPKDIRSKRYGDRGISVCPEWDSFEQFLKDMGPRPTPKHQIDREDNDGNYEPGNCRWVTNKVNTRNSSRTKLTIEKARIIRWYWGFAGMSLLDIAKEFNVTKGAVYAVVDNRTWL